MNGTKSIAKAATKACAILALTGAAAFLSTAQASADDHSMAQALAHHAGPAFGSGDHMQGDTGGFVGFGADDHGMGDR
ncbi:hypothetical protein AB0A70_19595 [Streptomyces morookaense]|uniref:hypothetical protein n=1 Tax=Streptomyces morookaense TaxID=1970 RepID=UPI0033D39E08